MEGGYPESLIWFDLYLCCGNGMIILVSTDYLWWCRFLSLKVWLWVGYITGYWIHVWRWNDNIFKLIKVLQNIARSKLNLKQEQIFKCKNEGLPSLFMVVNIQIKFIYLGLSDDYKPGPLVNPVYFLQDLIQFIFFKT